MDSHNTHGWLVAALLREMSGLSSKATFECVESNFSFNRCLRQGIADAPKMWQKMATQIFANVEEESIKKRKDILLDMEGERANQICNFMWTDSSWIMSHSKENSEQMSRDLVEEASRWDLEPKPANLWWTSTYASEEKNDMISGTSTACYKFPFEDTFNVLGCAMNRQEKNVRCCRRTDAVSKQGLPEGHCDIQEPRCSVEGKVSTSGGPCVCRLCLWK